MVVLCRPVAAAGGGSRHGCPHKPPFLYYNETNTTCYMKRLSHGAYLDKSHNIGACSSSGSRFPATGNLVSQQLRRVASTSFFSSYLCLSLCRVWGRTQGGMTASG